jgi:hypothetical protein
VTANAASASAASADSAGFRGSHRRPWTLVAGAALAVAEGVALAGWGGYQMVEGLVGHARTGVGLTEFGGVIVLVMGLLPLAAGWGLLRLKRWGRSPAVLMDTLCLAVTYFGWQTGGAMRPVGTLVGLAGLAGIVLLLHPRSTRALWADA